MGYNEDTYNAEHAKALLEDRKCELEETLTEKIDAMLKVNECSAHSLTVHVTGC